MYSTNQKDKVAELIGDRCLIQSKHKREKRIEEYMGQNNPNAEVKSISHTTDKLNSVRVPWRNQINILLVALQ